MYQTRQADKSAIFVHSPRLACSTLCYLLSVQLNAIRDESVQNSFLPVYEQCSVRLPAENIIPLLQQGTEHYKLKQMKHCARTLLT
jgi:hypothetical protein